MTTYFTASSPLLPEILSLHGKWRANREAVICGDQRLNWQQFTHANHQIAHGLLAKNLQAGDRAGVIMSNGLPMLHALMGVMAAGLVSVPINLSVNDEALINMMKDAEVSVLLVSEDQRLRVESLMADLPDTIQLFVSDGIDNNNWISMDEISKGQPTTLPPINYTSDSLLNIIYSSGTTGMPKGIAHNHAGRRDWAYDLCIALRYDDRAKILLTLGLYSNISWVGMLCTLLCGGTLVIHTRFDSNEFLTTVQDEKITHTVMVPIQYQRVLAALANHPCDLSSMRSMMSCGSPLHQGLKQAIFKAFACGIVELYGLTEGIITTLNPEEAQGRWSSVGRPLIGTDIAIINEQDEFVAAGQCGEIVSRGRITMPGYFNRADANQEAEFIDKQGQQWLRSGDIGQLDKEGYLYIVDRKKDMILSGGQNIYPQDIEAIIIEHPAINDVAVIGAKSQRWGETPIALAVINPNEKITTQEILTWANQKLGKQQRLADLLPIDELPRNPNGKILKRELRVQYGNQSYE